jgi:sigma54-dependent transcription regulator
MPEQADTLKNPLDTWRQFITDSERQWNGFFKEVLGTDTASSAMSTWVEASLTVQRMVADNLERYYTTFNIPTHNDLIALGERMQAIEESLSRLERAISSAVPAAVRQPVPPRPRPARTKRPVGTAQAANGTTGA